MNKKILILTVLISIFGLKINAQNLSSSPYSRFGVGELLFQGNGRQVSMGNTGVGDFNSFHISKINPTGISAIKPNSVIFEVGFFDKFSVFKDATSEKQMNNVTNFKYLMTGFRINKWWHAGVGITPFCGSGYKIKLKDSLIIDDYKTVYTNDYVGEGGVNQIYLTNSFSFLKHFAVGATVNYNFGSIDRKKVTVIKEKTYLSRVTNSSRNLIKKFNYRVGFMFADSIEKDEYSTILKYSVGGFYSNAYNINSLQTKYISRSTQAYNIGLSDSIFFDTVSTTVIKVPQTIGVGFSVSWHDVLTLNGDYIMSNWSKSTILGESGFFNSQFIGVGLEYLQSPFSSKYYKTIRYRIGGFHNKSYIGLNNKQVTTNAVTFGIGLPVKTVQLNLGVVVGQTGSTAIGLKENFYELNLGFSLYDLWFVKRKFL